MECFVIIVNGFQQLTIITKRSILDVAAVLDPPLLFIGTYFWSQFWKQFFTCFLELLTITMQAGMYFNEVLLGTDCPKSAKNTKYAE